jgi:hypothetical protein
LIGFVQKLAYLVKIYWTFISSESNAHVIFRPNVQGKIKPPALPLQFNYFDGVDIGDG